MHVAFRFVLLLVMMTDHIPTNRDSCQWFSQRAVCARKRCCCKCSNNPLCSCLGTSFSPREQGYLTLPLFSFCSTLFCLLFHQQPLTPCKCSCHKHLHTTYWVLLGSPSHWWRDEPTSMQLAPMTGTPCFTLVSWPPTDSPPRNNLPLSCLPAPSQFHAPVLQ